MFFEKPANTDFAGYANDNTPYTYSSNIRKCARQSTRSIKKMFHWFSTNNLVANAGKCHF